MSNDFSGTTGRIFIKLSRLIQLCNGLINFAFTWQSLKGRCHGNQLILGAFFQTTKLTAFSLCTVVAKRNAVSPSA